MNVVDSSFVICRSSRMAEDISYKDITVGSLLTELARRLPDHEALVYPGRDLRWSFRRLEEEALQVALGLLALGIEKGDRVAIWATNVPEWIVLQFALAKIGAILVTVNTALGRREVEYLLQQSEASTLILVSGFRGLNYIEILREMAPELSSSSECGLRSERLPHLRRVIYIGEDTQRGMIRYRELFDFASRFSLAELRSRESRLDIDE